MHRGGNTQAASPARRVSGMRGHSSVTTAADIYAHATEEADRAAADEVGTLLA